MTEFLEMMGRPFVACLILTGIHAYLGIHVVKRGVIFVDLALAQVAALGATLGFLFGFGLHSFAGYMCALGMTTLAAALFSVLRLKDSIVPQEAFIGIVYAVAAAAAILVLSLTPEGGEELKALFVGHLLFIDWSEIFRIALLYSLLGLLLWFTRKPIFLISTNPQEAEKMGYGIKRWDFFFYMIFGFVVTSSVELAGVLLVFSFLIVPAVCGVLLADSLRARLFTGWFIGFLTSVIGISLSFFLDLPTGATVVCSFGLILLVCLALRPFIAISRKRAV